MTTPTLVVAANGFTRDHVSITLNGGEPWQRIGPCLIPCDPVDQWQIDTCTVRFVTDNDLDDGEFRVVDADPWRARIEEHIAWITQDLRRLDRAINEHRSG